MTHTKKQFSFRLFTLFLISCSLVLSVNLFAQDKPGLKSRHKISSKITRQAPPENVVEIEEDNSPAPVAAAPVEKSTYPTKTHIVTLGLGQTFLFERYGKNGEDQITADLYYAYRSSYTWDFVANVHQS